ncbi:MAG: DNA methyltransferase, partial [Actinomycetota bacterium]|nr:DNA methyltransferase [Actinomycetota bacterium]
FAYCYALLANPEYVRRFWSELVIPGPHVPLTKDAKLFRQAAGLGTELIWLHTYGERFVPTGKKAGDLPKGVARITVPISQAPQDYPEHFAYEVATETLRVGTGEFKPVSQDVWNFSVSGYDVVRAWLAARMRGGSGKKSSSLDDLRPEHWTAAMTEELIRLLWILEATIELFPNLESTLDDILGSDLFTVKELPSPSEAERKPPAHEEEASDRALF